MSQPAVPEVEVVVSCVEGKRHKVRLRLRSWHEWEIVHNPCAELLGQAFGLMSPCSHAVRKRGEELRRKVVEQLGGVGSAAVPALIQALGDWQLRSAACWALGEIGEKSAVPVLVQVLGDREVEIRRAACQALGKIRSNRSVPALVEALRDVDTEVCRRACEALVKIGKSAVPVLVEILEDGDIEVRRRACEALGKIGDARAVPALRVHAEQLHEAHTALQRLNAQMTLQEAVQTLAKQGLWSVLVRALPAQSVQETVVQLESDAVPALIQALGDADKDVRRAACEVLGKIGDARAVPGLIGALRENHRVLFFCRFPVREAALKALVQIGAPAVPALLQALGDEDKDVRSAVCEALGEIGDASAVPALLQALGDEDKDVRKAACEALGEIGDASAVPALLQALGDEDKDVRKAACGALGKIGDASAVPALLQALGDEDKDVRSAVCEALGEIGDASAVPALLQALGDEDKDVRKAACGALGAIGDARAVPALVQALGDTDKDVRSAACEALLQIGKPAVPAFIQALGDRNASVRRVVCEVLGKIGDPSVVPELNKVVCRDPLSYVRQAAQEAIQCIRQRQQAEGQ